jgi:beta-lactam-binding protein with PASTA domain
MTDGQPDLETISGGRDEAGPGRAKLLLGGGLAVVLLATVGATAGYLLAGENQPADRTPTAAVTTAAAPTTEPPTDEPTSDRTTPPAGQSTPPTSATGLTVPTLVGMDFEQARKELRDRRLGWRLVFGTGTGRTVERTVPAAGTPVRRGATVALHVVGPAPAQPVPDVVGDDCDDAARELGEAGFYPRYPTGRTGKVTRQEPAADATAYWNDRVAIACGDAPPSPGAATPTP